MITKLKLRDFQSHKRTELDFSVGVNVISGPSDSGKTAILRALRWAVFNKPSGDSFISHWSDSCAVKVYFEGGGYVERGRAKNENYYLWSEDDEKFTAIGTGVPEQIEKFLNLSQINFQGQLDAPFLLSDSPGGVARHLNSVANLDLIDLGTTTINRWAVKAKNEVSNMEELEGDLVLELDKFDGLDLLGPRIKQLRDDRLELTGLIYNANTLSQLAGNVEYYDKKIKESEWIVELEPLVIEFSDRAKKVNSLSKLLASITEVDYAISDGEKYLELKEGVEEVEKLVETHNLRQAQLVEFTWLVKEAEDVERSLAYWSGSDLEGLEERFHELMPDQCPLCGDIV